MKQALFFLALLASFSLHPAIPISTMAHGATDLPLPPAVHVVVWRDTEGVYHACGRSGTIATGRDFITVTQAALDSLTPGRTTMETVLVASDAEIGPATTIRRLRISSYTIFDVAGTIHVNDAHAHIVPVFAANARHIEIPRLRVTGTPRFGLLFNSVSHVRLGNIHMEVTTRGVRIDRSGHERLRSSDIHVDRVFVSMDHQGGHAFETYGVDRLQVGQVMGLNTGGCVVLLNDTRDATVESVVGQGTSSGGGYATFRLANNNDNITVGQVVARGGGRGVFILSGTRNVNVGSVNLMEQEREGIFIEDAQNIRIGGGVVGNSNGVGVLVNSRHPGQGPGPDHRPAEGVLITHLRIFDDRHPARMRWAIEELGPNTSHNRFISNDLRGTGTEGGMRIFSETSVVKDNFGAGVSDGTVVLRSGHQPAARIEGVTKHYRATPSLRAHLLKPPHGETLAWRHHFEFNPETGQWDLIMEWINDPGQDIEVRYFIDQNA